jgi:hypothetical protein
MILTVVCPMCWRGWLIILMVLFADVRYAADPNSISKQSWYGTCLMCKVVDDGT